MATGLGAAADRHLTLSLTHACNLRCRYCYGGAKQERHMSLQTARAALELALMGTGARLHLVFFGGEPLLRWNTLRACTELAATLAARRNLALRPTVTTNGTLLDAERACWLRDHEFVVAVSCDGTASAHDANRRDARGRGSHATVVRGIRVALEAGLRVKVVVVVDPSTVDELPESVDRLAELGIRDLVLSPNWSASWHEERRLERWTQAYRRVAERQLASYRAGAPLGVSFLDTKITAHVRGRCLDEDRCDLGQRNLVVAPSGNLYPCDRLVGDDRDDRFVIGHVTRGPEPDRLAAIVRAAGRLPEACRPCAIVTRCQNRCACANVARSDALDAPSDLLCFHERIATELADEVGETLYREQNPAFLARFYGR